MRIVKYRAKKETVRPEDPIAADETMAKKFGDMQHAYETGFAASDGVRGGTAETDGRVRHPEEGDDTRPTRTPAAIEDENPGLADN